jgi:Co/Zn/Cd efflux system component
VNLTCALMLARYRSHGGSLTRAAFLSARNDVLANAAIIGAGLVTTYTASAWPDLIVGLGIFFMNSDAARKVYVAARRGLAEAIPLKSNRRSLSPLWVSSRRHSAPSSWSASCHKQTFHRCLSLLSEGQIEQR